MELKDRLIGMQRKLEMIPIVGVGELHNLYKSLYGRRYMIVLDDICRTQA